MAIHIIAEVWDHSRSSGTARLVALALADGANRESRLVWRSKRTLALQTGVSERSVQRALRVLEELGEIELVEPGGPPNRAPKYRIVPHPAARGQSGPTSQQSGDTAGSERGQPGSTVGTPTSPEPLTEPKGEPVSSSAPAREAAEEDLPKDFPDHLRPALEAVWPVIERVAQAKPSSAPPTREAVARAIATFPDRDHVDAASDVEQWLVHGTGRKTQVADVVQSYRRALARGRPAPSAPEPATRATSTASAPRYDQVMKR